MRCGMAQSVGHLGRNFKPKRGGMAQSEEHFVHIEGVVGSSPTVTTQKSVRTGTQMGYANAKTVRTPTGESFTSTIGH